MPDKEVWREKKEKLKSELKAGTVTTFVTGLLLILPIVITIAIMAWVAGYARAYLGSESAVGKALRSMGLWFVGNDLVATLIGWAIVLLAIWCLGLLLRTHARTKIRRVIDYTLNGIPFVRTIYRPISQVVGMLNKDDAADQMKGMAVVHCHIGADRGAGLIGLLASGDVFRFDERDCHVIYMPTSPLPMTGYILFVPVDQVKRVDMSVDDMMKIYFSLGVLSSQAIPAQYAGGAGGVTS